MESTETTPSEAPIEAPPPIEGPIDAATGEPAAPDVRVRRTSHRFKVEMTTEEKEEAVAGMLENLDKIEAVRARRKAEMAARKEEEEALLEQLVRQRAELRAGGTWMDVPCDERSNFTTCTVEIVRCDNAETVHTRAMTAEERQQSLFGDDTTRPANGHNGKGTAAADGIEGSTVVTTGTGEQDGHPPSEDSGWESSEREDGEGEPVEVPSPPPKAKRTKRSNGAAAH